MAPYVEGVGQVASSDDLSRLESTLSHRIEEARREASKSLSDAQTRLQGQIEQSASRLHSEISSLSREVDSAARTLSSVGSAVQAVAGSVQSMARNVADSLRSELAQSFQQYAGNVTEAMESFQGDVKTLGEEVKVQGETVVRPAFAEVSEAIGTLEERTGELSDELREKIDEVRTTLSEEIDAEREAIAALNATGERLLATVQHTNEIVLSLDKTFDTYQKHSLDRTRIRELIEGAALLETASKELACQSWSRAYQLFSEAERRLPGNDVRPALGKASARAGLGELHKAREILDEARSRNPLDPGVIGMRVRLDVALGEPERGIRLLEEYRSTMESQGDRVEGLWFYKLLGVSLYHTGKVEEAFATLTLAKQADQFGDAELRSILVRLGECEFELPMEKVERHATTVGTGV